MPFLILDAQGHRLFSLIFKHLPTLLFQETRLLDAPRLDALGRRTPRTPSARH